MNFKKIVIVVAMDKELAAFIQKFSDFEKITVRTHDVYIGKIQNKEIVLAKCGIGKIAAASFMTYLIETYHPDVVINMGIAGGYDRKLKTLDTIVASKVVFSDVDLTTSAPDFLPYGQMSGLPPYLGVDSDLIEKLTSIDESLIVGTIATGDQFVTNYQKCEQIVNSYFKEYDVLAFDMESGAILQVCREYNIPALIIRSISDIIGSYSSFDYDYFSLKASEKSINIVISFLEKI